VDNPGDVIVENANEGIDTVQSSVSYVLPANVENLTFTGTSPINGTGNDLSNVITGNGADNILDGGAGADTLIGGQGNDTYLVDNPGDIVIEKSNEGIDTVQSSITYSLGANVENLTLTGANAINGTGNELNNVITGNSADNVLNGGTGADTLVGGTGNDTYIVDNPGDVVIENPNEGTDTVQSSITYALGASVENLTLTGTAPINGTGNALNNVITGNSSDNVLDGGVGSDTLIGGQGNDTFVLDNLGDIVVENANEGIDTVQSSITYSLGANVENLTLTGTAAINGSGNGLNNVLTGNSADNVLDGGTGADTMAGGAGNDTYLVDNPADAVIENPNEGIDTIQSSVSYSLTANLENLILTGLAFINATGNDLDNMLTGNSGDNVLTGGKGNDTLIGGDGNDAYVYNLGDGLDTITDTGGADTILFGQGITRQNIVVAVDGSLVHIRILDAQGKDTGQGLDLNRSQDGNPAVETIQFSDGTTAKVSDFLAPPTNVVYGTDHMDFIRTGDTNDVIYAKGGLDFVFAGGGNDTVYGGDGTDWLNGEAGNDTLYGENDSDFLFGGEGNDVLDGGAGADVLVGGTGNDTYVVDNPSDMVLENWNEGTDTVQSSISYTLGDNVENLTLTGTASIDGTGNDLDNILTGNSGANVLTGGAGNDTLIGGAGNDTLNGGTGNDTYVFGRGDGKDVISDYDRTRGNTDTLAFGTGIADDQIWLSRSGNDLLVSIIGTQDSTKISNWYKGSTYQVEQFKTSDGHTLLNSQVDALVSAMAAFAPPASGQTTLPLSEQKVLEPIIAANWK
jgi:Ca2+-binding RTX toxin-like protein